MYHPGQQRPWSPFQGVHRQTGFLAQGTTRIQQHRKRPDLGQRGVHVHVLSGEPTNIQRYATAFFR